VLVGPGLFEWFLTKYVLSAGWVMGVVTALLGSSGSAPADDKHEKKGPWALIMSHALFLGAVSFTAVLVISLSLGTNYLLDLISTFFHWLISSVNTTFH